MKATLIKDNGRQRYYELSEPITKGKCDLLGEFPDLVKTCSETIARRIKEEYKKEALDSIKDGIRYIVVSDAHTHIERLVFPAVKFKDGNITGISHDIAGKHTFMIDGGDSRAVYPDEVYLRFLARLNGLTYEGIE